MPVLVLVGEVGHDGVDGLFQLGLDFAAVQRVRLAHERAGIEHRDPVRLSGGSSLVPQFLDAHSHAFSLIVATRSASCRHLATMASSEILSYHPGLSRQRLHDSQHDDLALREPETLLPVVQTVSKALRGHEFED